MIQVGELRPGKPEEEVKELVRDCPAIIEPGQRVRGLPELAFVPLKKIQACFAGQKGTG